MKTKEEIYIESKKYINFRGSTRHKRDINKESGGKMTELEFLRILKDSIEEALEEERYITFKQYVRMKNLILSLDVKL